MLQINRCIGQLKDVGIVPSDTNSHSLIVEINIIQYGIKLDTNIVLDVLILNS